MITFTIFDLLGCLSLGLVLTGISALFMLVEIRDLRRRIHLVERYILTKEESK